jgi:hypothetical protein
MNLVLEKFLITFSYWIFLWFLLYEIGVVEYNPKIWLIIATFQNVLLLLLMIYYKNKTIHIILFILINIFIKIIPIYILRNKSFKYSDFFAGLLLFFIYLLGLIYIFGSSYSIFELSNNILKKIKNKEIFSPLIYYIYKLKII